MSKLKIVSIFVCCFVYSLLSETKCSDGQELKDEEIGRNKRGIPQYSKQDEDEDKENINPNSGLEL